MSANLLAPGNILAIDTSADVCSIALAFQGEIRSCHHRVERQQAALVLPSIQQLLTQAKVNLQQLDTIAFNAGPGSFTGIRLAASVAQGLAFGAGIPVLPVSSLQTLAQGAYQDLQAENVLVAINAFVEEIYWGVYQVDDRGLMQPWLADQRCKPELACAPAITGSWLGVGDGWCLYGKLLNQQGFKVYKVCPSNYSRALEVLSLAQEQFSRGQLLGAEQALPVYLYPPEKWRVNPT